PQAVESLVKLSKGDMRRALNVLQACHAGSKPLAARLGKKGGAGKAETQEEAGESETITDASIYTCIAAPAPADIKAIVSTLLSTFDVISCLKMLQQLKMSHGIALADVITALGTELQRIEVPAATRVVWMQGLADIEYRLAGGGSEAVQTGGLVGVVRTGCELAGGLA
ncbi:hypothetical protein KEM52_002454, partial [Ascosphaera acerosa]